MSTVTKSVKFYLDTALFKFNVYLKKKKIKGFVKKTKPIDLEISKQEDEVLFMSLFCHKDVYEGIAAFKSLYRFLDFKYPLTLIEDGTLTENDIQTIKYHLKNCKIIRRKQAESEVINYLKSNGFDRCLKMRKDFLMALKLFDASYYSFGKRVVIIDTDILFFAKPLALIDLINRAKLDFSPFYNQDLHTVYSYKVDELEKFSNVKILQAVNAGFIGWVPKPEIFSMTESFLALNLPYESPWLVEQTMYGLYFSMNNGKALPEEYDVMARHARNGLTVVCQHYAGFLRPHFYRQYFESIHKELI